MNEPVDVELLAQIMNLAVCSVEFLINFGGVMTRSPLLLHELFVVQTLDKSKLLRILWVAGYQLENCK